MNGDEAERYVPETMGGDLIAAEHEARYRLVLPHVADRRVLDAGCGVGWAAPLLIEAGAAAVTGVDIADDAIAAARERGTTAEFVAGNLVDLPFADGVFDVVVCFEALEHVADSGRVLDELVRVLTKDGLLFVSSPNPEIYPPGNPFHVHELLPAELHSALAERLVNAALYRQHLFVASLLVADGEYSVPGALHVGTHSVSAIAPGVDPYSVVVASNASLPAVRGIQVIAPSHQLAQLDATAKAMLEERAAAAEVIGTLAAIASARDDAERRLVDADAALRSMHEQVRVADAALHRLASELSDANKAVHGFVVERDSALVERDAARTERDGARAERDAERGAALAERSRLGDALAAARAATGRTAAERDRFGAALVRSEQTLAMREQNDPTAAQLAQLRERFERTAAECDEAVSEVIALRQTVSWRVTAPLRRIRAKLRGA